ncbi:MAG: hypothetical protein M0R80_29295 [Proteobacteria bacterium]|jgi:hypothetical protein|nr:hypothetical protein [Pseudomonadota bacterium]
MNATKGCVLCTSIGAVFVGVITLVAISTTGCGGVRAGSFQSQPTFVPLAERDYRFVQHGLRGEACKTTVLGFGIDDHSYAAAIKQVHRQVLKKYRPDYQLVNVVEDWTFKFFLLAWKNCTVVSADVVVFGDPDQIAPPPTGEAGSDEATQMAEQEEPPVAAEEATTDGEAPDLSLKKDTALDGAPTASDGASAQTIKKVKSKKSKDASKSPYNE